MKIKEYIILTDNSLFEMEKRVNNFINNEYKPQGGICIIPEDRLFKYNYAQAMVRYED